MAQMRAPQSTQQPPGPLSLLPQSPTTSPPPSSTSLPPSSDPLGTGGSSAAPGSLSPLGPVTPPPSSGVSHASGMILDGVPSSPVSPHPPGPYDDTILPLELRRFAVIAAVVILVTAGLCFWASTVATSRCRVRYGGPLGVPEGPVTRIVENLRGSIIAATTAID